LKTIAISSRITEAGNYVEPRNSLAMDWDGYSDTLEILPVIIPNGYSDATAYFRNLKIDGLILSGGNNIVPALFGADYEASDAYPERDETEYKLIEYCLEKDLPILGVCRGMQILNVYFGGTLTQGIQNHVNKNHRLNISGFQKYFGESHEVNSFHNFGIYRGNLADDLEVFAECEDGVIEGFSHKKSRVAGIQWHPERKPGDSLTDRFIKDFFEGVIIS
jgi:putative glutamine amidotransferase